MEYKVIIPARANSKRIPGKNLKLLGKKPLIEYSIDYALSFFPKTSIWVNSDSKEILEFSKLKGVNTLLRPDNLANDLSPTVDALKYNLFHFEKNKIKCDAFILLQPTSPFRDSNLLNEGIYNFEKSKRKSLASFSKLSLKIGAIEGDFFNPINYIPGQRSQDLDKTYYENGLLYITKRESIRAGKVITSDVFPLIYDSMEKIIDIDTPEDFVLAELMLKLKNEN